MKTTVTVTVEGAQLEVTGVFTPFEPAKVNAAPEDCYPEEGGTFEIESIHAGGVNITNLLDDWQKVEDAAYTRCVQVDSYKSAVHRVKMRQEEP